MRTGWIIFWIAAALFVGIPALGYTFGWFGEAAQVTQEELGPRAMLEKYEEFKDMAAQLDAKRASIGVLEQNIKDMEEDYEGQPRQNWTREDRQQHSQWKTELAAIKSSHNDLAGQYNANMAKWNYRFANAGDMPECAYADGTPCPPLPRSYEPYIVE